jgi:hypothetical protein
MATINICDICGAREDVSRRSYPYDRRPDGAGGSETVSEIYDLCQTHELIALKLAIKTCVNKTDIKDIQNDWSFNQLIINEIKQLLQSSIKAIKPHYWKGSKCVTGKDLSHDVDI